MMLFFLYLPAISYSQQNEPSYRFREDSLAIIKLLDTAAKTFRSGDTSAYDNCWLVRPYSIILISTADGKAITLHPDVLGKPSASMGKGGYAEASNYRMSIHADDAWVSFDEVSTAENGVKSYSHEIWMIERAGNAWKLVAASLHFYKLP